MRLYFMLFILLQFLSLPSHALSKDEVRKIIKSKYPDARITEIEKEKYKGDKVYEVDFQNDGKRLEAIISIDGDIIKMDIDD
ncbi:MAG: PepSY domain-containing protein [Candidatus Thiodiazotropha sp.]|nr:PepSY-like domain-containing protein [Candidatus Thiodiazotropha taylori]